jgi:hypothetical protein
MSTIQLIGLAVAIVVLIVLIVTLVVTRGRGGAKAVETPTSASSMTSPAAAPGSIFDEAPRDELAELGKAVETPPTVSGAAAPAAADVAMAGVAAAAGAAAVADETPAEGGVPEVAELEAAVSPTAEAVGTAEGAGLAGLEEAQPREPEPTAQTTSAEEEAPGMEEAASAAEETPSAVEEPSPAEEEPIVAEEPPTPAEEAASAAASVALSDIIVTTNQQQIDLDDPEVRRLIKDLIEDEIELAQQYKVQGQTVDAVLQLTEAEKACNALGLTSKARLIRAMIKELKD